MDFSYWSPVLFDMKVKWTGTTNVGRSGSPKVKVKFSIDHLWHKWSIENFDFAMGLGGGKVESDSFHIPGVLGEFQLMIDKNKFPAAQAHSTSLREQKPTKLKLNDEEFEAKHYFSVE